MTRSSDDDEVLMAELAQLIRARSGPPPALVDVSKQLFIWRTVDAELARLTYDSLLDDQHAGTRSAGSPRIVSFDADDLTIEVEVDETPGARRLLGQLVPASAADLELRSATGTVLGRADDLGRFVLPLPPDADRASLRCVLVDGSVVESSWTLL